MPCVASHLLGGYSMRQAPKAALLVVLATTFGCEGAMPPPPILKVTSPHRGLVQGGGGQIMVTGTTEPSADGDRVVKVKINEVPAQLAADGSFSALVDVPDGATLLETVAISDAGGSATDARTVHAGQLRPIGTPIDRAVTVALSAEAFAKLSAASGPLIKSLDLGGMLAAAPPMARLGDDYTNLQLSVKQLTLGDVKITLTPVDGGLQFSAQLDGLSVSAKAAYGGYLVPDGSTTVTVGADSITVSGTLVVTPTGTAGFTTKIASPSVRTTGLKMSASGLVGTVLDLLEDNLGSTVTKYATSAAERGIEPAINIAFGALAGPKTFDVLGNALELQASPSAITFTRAGALVSMNISAKVAGSESSPGYIFTPNGTPNLDVTKGVQIALADDLLNGLLASIHAKGLLDLHLDDNFGLFDKADFKLSMPPMISANNSDGSLRLVLGDMIATFTKQGKPVIAAAINASVDLQILNGTTAQELAFQFGKVRLWVNVIGGDDATPDQGGEMGLDDAASAGIGVQLDSLSEFLVTLPLPSVAGVQLDHLAMRADAGYVVASAEVH